MTDNKHTIVASRRRFIRNAGVLALTAPLISRAALDTGEGVTFAGGERPLVQFPEKRKLILVHSRPPHLETPFSVF